MKRVPLATLALAALATLIVSGLRAQANDSPKRVSQQIALDMCLSRVEGDAPAYVRQSANDFSTNFGTSATYRRAWAPGVGISSTTTLNFLDFLGLDASARLGVWSSREVYEVRFDPPNSNGLTYSGAQLSNRYLNFSPSIALRGTWWRLSLCAGIEASVFLLGHTKWEFSYEATSGNGASEEDTRLDTQDQPIYVDPLHGGGIADYTQVTNRNHGANPVWLAGLGKLEMKLLDTERSPVVGVGWRMPFMEILRSQNPSWSLTRGLSADLTEMNNGTKISTMSLHVGWSF